MDKITEDIKLVQKAAGKMISVPDKKINSVLNDLSESAVKNISYILQENARDLEKMDKSDPKYDRLKLTADRIKSIADDIRSITELDYPVGRIIYEKTLPNGLITKKISVPLGVVGIIYEARPNVTFDVFSLCFKSGNACILKGGSEAAYSNSAIVTLIREVLVRHGLDENMIYLMPPDRKASEVMLNAVGLIDVIIPRGGRSLIDFVRMNSRIPVIETGAGIVHTYFDEYGDLEKGIRIIENAKTRRVSVCNALDCLIIHSSRLSDLPAICKPLAEKNVKIYADAQAYYQLGNIYPSELLYKADDQHFGTEFLSLKMAIRTVDSLDAAIAHISQFGSKHSEAIISENEKNIETFMKRIDAAAVYANTSTAFTDGAQFGLGAEIGISTQKLHARGPMGLNELTTYKWIIYGDGQTRNP